jgi:hypothetical protein
VLGRFLSPDPIVPNPANPQDLNRYTYVYNNPLRYTDPTGHCVFAGADTVACVAGGALVVSAVGVTTAFMGEHFVWGSNAAENREAFASPVVGAINFAREVKDTIQLALPGFGEATSPGGLEPEDPHRNDWGETLEQHAKRSGQTASTYRERFFRAAPQASTDLRVHHTLPQKYERLLWRERGINVHETRFLRGVEETIHKQITRSWERWERHLGRTPTADDILKFAKEIEEQFGAHLAKP